MTVARKCMLDPMQKGCMKAVIQHQSVVSSQLIAAHIVVVMQL